MANNAHDAETHFSKLLERASRGDDVFISKSGVPVAVLKPKRELGFATGAFSMSDLTEFNAPLDPGTMTLFSGQADH